MSRRRAGGRVGVVLALPALAVLLAGCAGDPTPGTGDGPPAASASPTAPATGTPGGASPTPAPSPTPSVDPTAGTGAGQGPGSASLTITVDETGAGAPRTLTLTCDPAGGDHPDAAAACATLAAVGPAGFDEVPADVLCTQQYGGPQVATVEGTVAGAPVSARFTRTDGCEISRWDALAPLLPASGGGM